MNEPISQLLTRAFTNPLGVLDEVSTRLDDATRVERCELLRVMGNACRELRRTRESRDHLEAAVALAIDLGDLRLEGLAAMSLAATLSYGGEFARSLELVDRAITLLIGDDRIAAMSQRAGLLQRAGHHTEALTAFNVALDATATANDQTIRGDLWMNRGVLLGLMGDIDAAEADTQRAFDLFDEVGWTKRAADMQHNLAWLAGRRGDIVQALHRFDDAQTAYENAGVTGASVFPDRCEVLIAAGLAHEALAAAERSAGTLAAHGGHVDHAEALLLVARAALLADAPDRALSAGNEASVLFSSQDRQGWSAAAASLALAARLQMNSVDRADRQHALSIAVATQAAGLHAASVESQLLAAEISSAADDWASCEIDLIGIDEHRLGFAARFQLKLLRCRLAAASGRTNDALEQCAQALDEFAEVSAALGGMELRAHVARHVEGLADLGVRLALEGGDPIVVLEWAERQRSSALAAPPVRPPADPDLERDLNTLRSSLAELDQQAQDGATNDETRRRCAQAQDRVRRRTRHAPGTAAVNRPFDSVVDIAKTTAATWIVYFESQQQLYAVQAGGDSLGIVDLGPVAAITRRITALQRSLSLHLGAIGRGVTRDPIPILSDAAELDTLLFPGTDLSPQQRVVVCPTGRIYDLPWGLLPTLRSTAFVLAPSIATYRRCESTARTASSRVTAVAGPGLRFADDEVAAVISVYGTGKAITSAAATADTVKTELQRADVAHLVCHGRFVFDNPMFSSLVLHDGSLFVHELERLRPCPTVTVLSACHAGLHGSPTGREILGVAASLLAAGSRSVVAATVPIPDAVSTVSLMRSIHARIAVGDDVASALRDGRAADPILGGAFSCHGAA